MSFLLSLFLLSGFPACWASCHFPCAGLSSRSASTTGAFAELGFCWAWPPPRGGQAEVVSAMLNLGHSTIDIRGVCNFLGSVLPQQKIEVTDGSVLQLSLIWQAKENTSLMHEGGRPKRCEEREAPGSVLASPFICFFSLPRACSM